MDTREQLYVDLMMDQMPGDCNANVLISNGYLTENLQHTPKALDFMREFLDSKKDVVLQSIRELGPDTRKSVIMQRAGIKQMGVLADVVNILIKEGKVKKDNGKFYIVD
ncbi:hypothetical protein [Desulforamulus ferrireducens]|uniref:Uncharacterized protein n=1 Tax=Desulforamulus ferrireducens TaxID=1833852 RepID=A0A1S6J0M1_9FIRM|nr:hypothetical protein [Desulforamulus ferrireducens]AQS60572.1 hypothetical protein B0537_10040 [Desulforamulus ferrireducens]